jgi:Tripartite tricarboxylate transporter family receptor
MMTGVTTLHVSYRGQGPALADLLARQVQIMFVTAAASIEYMPSTAGFTSRQSRCPLTHVAVGRRGAVGGPGYSSRAASRATGLAGVGRASTRRVPRGAGPNSVLTIARTAFTPSARPTCDARRS